MLKNKDRWLKKFIGFILCFGGGVLVSTIFIHMLSEVKETLSQAAEFGAMPEDSEYPFPELIVLMGFLFILLVETIAAKFLGGHGHHGHSHGHSHENQHTYGTNNGYNHNESIPFVSHHIRRTMRPACLRRVLLFHPLFQVQ